MFRALIARAGRGGAVRGHAVRRQQWERDASVRLRAGDFSVVAAYDRRGRIRGGDREAAYDRAAGAWLADHLHGRDAILLAGSNEEAAELARRVQAQLVKMGTVVQPRAPLADGNRAGTGDLIRARLNTAIDAGGQRLTNRDVLRIEGWQGQDAEVGPQAAGRGLVGAGSWCPAPTSPLTPNCTTRAISTWRRAGPSTPRTCWSRTRCPGSPFTSGMSRGREIEYRARGHRGNRPGRKGAVRAGDRRGGHPPGNGTGFPRAVGYRADPGKPGMGVRDRARAQPVGGGNARRRSIPRLTPNCAVSLPRANTPGTRKNTSARPCLRRIRERVLAGTRCPLGHPGNHPVPAGRGPVGVRGAARPARRTRSAPTPRCPGRPGPRSPRGRSPGRPRRRWTSAPQPWVSGSSPSPSRGSCGTSDRRPGRPSPDCRRCSRRTTPAGQESPRATGKRPGSPTRTRSSGGKGTRETRSWKPCGTMRSPPCRSATSKPTWPAWTAAS